jgi:tRNA (guanine26-N2/guanine27-N2)-dimethyltransferase
MGRLAQESPASLGPPAARLLAALEADPGQPARCWPLAEIGRRLGGGPPRLERLLERLRQRGHRATASGVMAGQIRSDAPWREVLAGARALQAERNHGSAAAAQVSGPAEAAAK